MRVLPYLTAQKVVSGLVISFLDIDKQKEAVSELSDSNQRLNATLQELSESRDRLKSVLETVPAAVMLVEQQDGRITVVNKEAVDLSGGDSTDLTLQKFFGRLSVLRPDGSACPMEEFPPVQSLRSGVTILNREVHFVRPDGSRIVGLVSAAPLCNENGAVAATVAVFRDITEYKQAARMKDDFIGMVSHELRTPITVVSSAIKTLNDERVSEEDRRVLLQEADSSAESLARILDNLLELTKYQAGRLMLDRKPTSVAETAQGTLKKLLSRYPGREATLDIPSDLPRVSVDPERLERIIYNLVENAFKYSDDKGEVRIFARREKDRLAVGVSDQGPGIASEDQDRIFEPFNRLKNGIKSAGVGLGLVVCKRLVEAHGGRVWVESRPGEGSTFLFTIPLEEEGQTPGRR
jgi:PAS domain S-box-containing protein